MTQGCMKAEGDTTVFINLSNHSSCAWDERQRADAHRFGHILDISFPKIKTDITEEQMNSLVDEYYGMILCYKKPVVLLLGEFVFVFRLVTRLKQTGIRVVSTCTERCVEEESMPDGSVHKVSKYYYRGLRDY